MNEQTVKLLEDLANKLGTTSEYLWEVLLKQAHIGMVKNIITIIICVLVLVLAKRVYKWLMVKDEEGRDKFHWNNDSHGKGITVAIFGGILSLTSVILIPVNLYGLFVRIYNPEFKALNYILEQV